MKFKAFALAVILVLALIFSAGCVSEKDSYVVGFNEANNVLLNIDSETGDLSGAGVDLFNWIAEDQGLNLKFVLTSDYQSDLKNGVIDIISFSKETDEAKVYSDFVDQKIVVNYGFVAKKSSDITVEEALSGNYVIACVLSSPSETWLKSYFGEDKFNQMVSDGKIICKYTVNAALVDVDVSTADVCLSNSVGLSNMLMEWKSLKYIGSIGSQAIYATSVQKGNTELLEKLNQGYANFMDSDYFDVIADRYGILFKKDTYIVGMNKDYAPFSYLDENGEPAGFDVECLDWIADKYGFNVEYQYMPWSQGVYSVETRKIDMFYSALTITDERSAKVTFSNPYYSVGNAVAQMEENDFTAEMFERGELVVGLIEGTTTSEWVLSFYGDSKSNIMISEGKIISYPDSDSRLQAFLNGEVDVIFSNGPSTVAMTSKYPIEIIKEYPTDELYAAGVENGDTILLEMINNGLAELESSGVKAELLKKYNLD